MESAIRKSRLKKSREQSHNIIFQPIYTYIYTFNCFFG